MSTEDKINKLLEVYGDLSVVDFLELLDLDPCEALEVLYEEGKFEFPPFLDQ